MHMIRYKSVYNAVLSVQDKTQIKEFRAALFSQKKQILEKKKKHVTSFCAIIDDSVHKSLIYLNISETSEKIGASACSVAKTQVRLGTKARLKRTFSR